MSSSRSVTVIMPVYNSEAYIAEALKSALGQGLNMQEIIIVDDGSTDLSREIIAAFDDPRIRIIEASGKGVSAARNQGAALASASWLMFLDADDLLLEGAIDTLLQGALAHPECVAVYGDYERIDEGGSYLGFRRYFNRRAKPSGYIVEKIVTQNSIVNGGIMLVSAATFRQIGGFDPEVKYCEDWLAWCRLATLGPIIYLPGSHVLNYRIHEASQMHSETGLTAQFSGIVERIFSDKDILNALPQEKIQHLKRQAETHIATYEATRLMAMGHYKSAFSSMLKAIKLRPASTAKIVIRMLATRFAGF